MQIAGDRGCTAACVVEDEHPDAACLAVPHRRESNLSSAGSSGPQRLDDGFELLRGPRAEKCERDVEVIAPDHADTARELSALPALDLIENVSGETERKKEPEPFIPAHARG